MGELVRLRHHPPPIGDLLVDVDLDRTDIAATAVQRRGERQLAVLVGVERGVKNNADRTRVGRSVAQTAAAAIHGAGVHARPAANAFERCPEVLLPQPSERPLSTRTICISPPSRGPRICEVYCVIGEPGAPRQQRARIREMLESRNHLLDPDRSDVKCGMFAERSAFPRWCRP